MCTTIKKMEEPSEYIMGSFSRDMEYVETVFLNAPYDKQVLMYATALHKEYYEVLQHLVKFLPELPEEFMDDVDKIDLTKLSPYKR
jgi:hypothetical protein